MAESHLKLVTPATFYERLRLDAQCRRSRQGERPTLSAPAYADRFAMFNKERDISSPRPRAS